jgi:sec-independent protein translocase protein TatB
MFDFGAGELIVIGVVALVAIGPKELPGLLRTVGQAVGKMRRMAGDFQNQFSDAMREADMAEAQKLISDIKSDMSGVAASAEIKEVYPTLAELSAPAPAIQVEPVVTDPEPVIETVTAVVGEVEDKPKPTKRAKKDVAETDDKDGNLFSDIAQSDNGENNEKSKRRASSKKSEPQEDAS